METLFVLGFVATLAGLAVPTTRAAVDTARVESATWFMAAQLRLARMTAVMTGRAIGYHFEAMPDGFRFTGYRDGDGDGIRLADIRRGVDPPTGPSDRLPDRAPGVDFGIVADVRAIDGGAPLGDGDDPVRIGSADLLTFTPQGTATSGTLFIRGRGARQYAIRVLGATGRIRVLEYQHASAGWVER